MKVFLSKKAETSLLKLDSYLMDTWGDKVRKQFHKVFHAKILQVSSFPNSCPASFFSPGVHKYVVTKQTSLYNRVNTKTIEIIAIIDSRQNPKAINLLSK